MRPERRDQARSGPARALLRRALAAACVAAGSATIVLASLASAALVPAVALGLAGAASAAGAQAALRVGSKRFTESYVLGEILAQTARAAGVATEHKPGLGNTAILLEALKSDAIDVYPEYTGTIAREILKTEEALDLAALNARLAPLGLAAATPFGFNNTYAIGMRRADAQRLGVRSVSDLVGHPKLRWGLSHEFLGRRDGWPGLREAYALPHATPRGLDHGLAYEALAAGEIDAMDLYSTDAKIARYDIVALTDDRGFFPAYDALLLFRREAPARFAEAFRAFAALEGAIDAPRMVALNARAEIDKLSFEAVAAEFLAARRTAATSAPQAAAGTSAAAPAGAAATPKPAGAAPRSVTDALFAPDFWRLAAEHTGLVLGSLVAAAALGIPLGVLAARRRALAQPLLALTGLVQTVPSLALLAFLIPLTGMIGLLPALIALFLYALLPIVRNTHAGLEGVPGGLREAARALALPPATILARIELPLAMPVILAGVKTAAVINVGTATIAAFIGAGGFGERIAQGLALNDHALLVAGALPAAALALIVHVAFEWSERRYSRLARAQDARPGRAGGGAGLS